MSINKSTWGDGPWQHESDRVEFEHAGFPCLIVRHGEGGHLCGYVAVPPGHPWHGSDDIGDVHGGVTYAKGHARYTTHAMVPDGSEDMWWIGFDAAHLGDFTPGLESRLKMNTEILGLVGPTRIGYPLCGTYRTIEYMRHECERLASQAALAAL